MNAYNLLLSLGEFAYGPVCSTVYSEESQGNDYYQYISGLYVDGWLTDPRYEKRPNFAVYVYANDETFREIVASDSYLTNNLTELSVGEVFDAVSEYVSASQD